MTGNGPLGLLGIGRRAGLVVVGTQGVRAALKRNELALVIVAQDASSRTRDKVMNLAAGRAVPVRAFASSDALGQTLGRDAVQAVGVRDRRLAEAIESRIAGE